MVASVDESKDLSLIRKMRKGGKKNGCKRSQKEQSCSLNDNTEDLSRATCFKCHKKGYYASQCLQNKKENGSQQHKNFARSVKPLVRVDQLTLNLEIGFSMVSCLFSNTTFSVGQYVEYNGVLGCINLNKNMLNKIQEQDIHLKVKLGDNATYSDRNGLHPFLDYVN